MTSLWSQLEPGTCALGESPFWHPHEQMLYWVDIVSKQILRANIYMREVQRWDMPSEPGCIAPAARGGLVIALRDGVYRAPDWAGMLHRIAALPYDAATIRANDGKCDALGRLWVGTVDETRTQAAAALYCVDARQGAPCVLTQVSDATTGNGLGWDPAGTRLYWADTPRHVVRAWNFDLQHNRLGSPVPFLQLAPKPQGWTSGDAGYGGRPDGAAVDAQGNYWVAMYEGARICQYAPDGTLLRELPTPVQCPTMPCFGGEDYKTLYITSARHGRSAAELDRMPASGAVFYTRVDTPGLPVNFFKD